MSQLSQELYNHIAQLIRRFVAGNPKLNSSLVQTILANNGFSVGDISVIDNEAFVKHFANVGMQQQDQDTQTHALIALLVELRNHVVPSEQGAFDQVLAQLGRSLSESNRADTPAVVQGDLLTGEHARGIQAETYIENLDLQTPGANVRFGRTEVQGDDIGRDKIIINPLPSSSEKPKIVWHRAGAIALGVGAVGVLLFAGLGHLLLQGKPILQGILATMSLVLASLVGFFGLHGDKTLLPALSQWVGQQRYRQIGIGSLLFLSLFAWGTIGWMALSTSSCDPDLGCKQAGEQWFAVADWQIDSANDQSVLAQGARETRRILYQKLNLAESLRGIAINSPQVSEQVRSNLDYWIEGTYRRSDMVRLAADIAGPGGVFYSAVSVEGPADVEELEADTCILDLQTQLAFRIFDALDVPITDDIRESVRRTPTHSCQALLLNNEAVVVASEGSLYLAELKLREVVTIDPNYAEAHGNLGEVLRRQGNWAGAIQEYKTAIEIQPDYAVHHFNLGLAYNDAGQYDESIAAYKRATELDQAYFKAFNNLGFVYLQMGELDLAEAALVHGIKINSQDQYLHKNLGRVSLEQGNASAAVADLQEAVRLAGESPFAEALYYLAIAYARMDAPQEACGTLHAYQQSADTDSDRIEAAATLATELNCSQQEQDGLTQEFAINGG